MATQRDDKDIHGLIEKMHELLEELERACQASRTAWNSFIRLQQDLSVSSEALRPLRHALYKAHPGNPQSVQ